MSGTKEQKNTATGVSGSSNQVKGDVVTIHQQIIYQTTTNDQRLINKAKTPDLKLPVQTAESMKNPVKSFSCIGEASSIRESEHNAAEALMKQLKKELNITFSIVKNVRKYSNFYNLIEYNLS